MEKLKQSILIPVDFREQSLAAIKQAYNLARINKFDLTLLYVLEDSSFWSGLFSDFQEEELIKRAKANLENLAERTSKESGLIVHSLVRKGRAYVEINEVAEEIEAKYIFMGIASVFSGENKSKRIVGANASRVIRSAKCPVLTVNGENHFKGCRSILLPLDLTKETRQKVKYAVEIAKAYHASIKTVSVIWDTDDEEIRWKMNITVNQVKEFIQAEGIKCATEIIDIDDSKHVVDNILGYAYKQGDIDLIVIMTRAENSIVEFFVGSKAQEIIRLSDIPIMSITPKDLDLTYMR